MTEGIYFYENNGEEGLSRVRVSPGNFRVPVAPDGTTGKLSAGRDVYDHRKRERIGLWKKFANYMLAYCRELEGPPPADEATVRLPALTEPTSPPSDVVTFYQRFGDVGCWVFLGRPHAVQLPRPHQDRPGRDRNHVPLLASAAGGGPRTWRPRARWSARR